MSNLNYKQRYWEIDFLRGVAVIMMVIFHLLFDLYFFTDWQINVSKGFWLIWARITAILFIFLVGAALTLSYNRACERLNKKQMCWKFIKRGFWIFSWGLLLTVLSYLFVPQYYIIFGILHLIGLSIVLAYPFIKLKIWNFLIGAVIIITWFFLKKITFGFYWFLWLGLIPKNFSTLDYFPLLPWFGIILFGIATSNYLYPNGKRIFKINEFGNFLPIKFTDFLGRHSLFIYLIHQPIIIAFVVIAIKATR